jgi:arylsulfatase
MPQKVQEMPKKPNILVSRGGAIGINNLNCYSHGVMGYRTPNIDRLAKEGMMFTDSYASKVARRGARHLLPARAATALDSLKLVFPVRM